MKNFDEFLLFFLSTFGATFITLSYFSRALNPRVKKYIPFIPTMLVSLIGNILLTFEFIPKTVFSLVFNACLIVSICVFYINKPQQKLLTIVLYYLISFTLDYSSFLFALMSPEELPKSIVLLVFCVTLALSLRLAANYLNKRMSGEIDKKASVFLLIPISHLATYVAISYYEAKELDYFEPISQTMRGTFAFSAVLMTCFIFSLVIDIFVFRHYIKSLDAAKLKAENDALKYRNKMNEQYFESLKDTELEFHKIRHDIGGSLQVVKELIYEQQKLEDAKNLFDSLSESVQSIHSGFYCQNSLVNAILVSKEKQCQKNKIPFEATVQLPTENLINESDFCRVLINLLDNAIEANLAVAEGRFLHVVIKSEEDTIFIRVRNIYNGQSLAGTSKKNKEDHGYGLRILQDYAKKYNGSFLTEVNEDRFCATMALKLSEAE